MSVPTLKAHAVSSLEDRVRVLQDLVYLPVGGLRDPTLRQIGLMVTRHCPPRDDRCELQAVFDYIVKNVRYTGDIVFKDTFQSALRTQQYHGGDCLPLSTLVLANNHVLTPVGDLQPGDRVWGDGSWVTVQEAWITGEKPILAFDLNNGSALRCSPEHRVFLADGSEVRAEDVKVGQKLLTPREPLVCDGRESWTGLSDADFAWFVGVYLADGWWDRSRIAISGRDGKPKEAQKKRVQTIMEGLGVSTRWHERYIAVNDRGLADYMSVLGHHAPGKHLNTLRFSRDQVGDLIAGLRADGCEAVSGTFVHSTTSAVLALQLRVLYRMLGQSTHIRRVDNHGGLGSNPIYRITVRSPVESYDRKRVAVRSDARVVAIREDGVELCGDITVEGGRFWLPESDVMVHNCDDHAVLAAVLAMENGFQTKFRITSNTGQTWDHIYTMAGIPKHAPTKWVALDTTMGPGKFGHQPPRRKLRDFTVGRGG
jgi:hypothetical protein